MTIDPVIATMVRVLFAVLFASAVRHKVSDWRAFRIVVHDYEIVPARWVTAAAVAVVSVEAFVALAFAWRASAGLAAAVALVLLTAYSTAIAVNLLRGRRTLECGCAPSKYRQALSEWLLVRNAVLLVGCAALLVPTGERETSVVDAFTCVAGISVAVALWNTAHRLLPGASDRPSTVAVGEGAAG